MKTRAPAVAGRFYPGDAQALRRAIEIYLAQAPAATGPHAATGPKAIIAPHAGYPYSGPIAASAFARFLPEREIIKRIVLLGPSHYVEVDGLALSTAQQFETPLGLVPVDAEACARISRFPQVIRFDPAHKQEHSLEVELPFLQVVLQNFSVVPLAVGEATAEQVAEVLDELWGGPETRFVISSDLSHYHPWAEAQELDHATADAIAHLRPEDINPQHACGRIGIRGLLVSVRRHNLSGEVLDLRNSGDTAGTRDRVVGYGAFEFK